MELLWGVCRAISITPHWFRFHVIQPIIVLFMLLLRYRRKVILSNLERSFPQKSHKEHLRIMYLSIRRLCEAIVGTISLAGASKSRKRLLMEWENGAEHYERTKGRDWIAMASHYGCWEYFLLWCSYDTQSTFLAVYHPLKSKVFERFYSRLRALEPTIRQTPMHDTVREYLRTRSEKSNTILGLIADQNPPLRPDSHWFNFLNQETVFFDGAEKLALRFRLPVYFVNVKRLSAGRYSANITELYNGEEELAPNELTERYVRALDEMICQTPELWMWSHKRWKHTRQKQQSLIDFANKR